ncbi:MAG TPA: hypothetical protein VGC14_02470 [Rhizobium sp.]
MSIDLTGRRVGRMRIICREAHGWKCLCNCGKEPIFSEEELKRTRSCGCIVIMGLDLATNSGWAVRYSWRHSSAALCGVFNSGTNDGDDKVEWEAKYALAANMAYKLILEHKPDFIAIEAPEHNTRRFGKKDDGEKKVDVAAIKTFVARLSGVMMKFGLNSPEAVKIAGAIGSGSSNSNQMQLSGIVGAVIGACIISGTPYGTIGARTWHSQYYGKGNKPAPGKDWKDLAIETCERENINLPRTKKDKRDAAEAIGVATCWRSCAVPNIKWMQDRFTELCAGASLVKKQRNERTASHDLFGSAA